MASGLGTSGALVALYVSLSSRATNPMRTCRSLAEVVQPLNCGEGGDGRLAKGPCGLVGL